MVGVTLGGSMNKKQLTELVIIPTLKEIPFGYSDAAVMAIQMIIAHESACGTYIAQTKGPALGIIQMEPATHDDVWVHGDSIKKNALLLGLIDNHSKKLIYDLRYNVFMARQKLFMAKGALPTDEWGMAEYLKKHWNGYGKATATKYHFDYINWV
tara:strand:+ start:2216 stop:2680 length:465 start_codon:yes stop_codon:yes gene_type:complete